MKFLLLILPLFLAGSLSAQVHLSENFNGNTIPAGWTVTNLGSGACQWMIRSPHTEPLNNPVTMLGNNYLFVNSDSAGTGTVANETITSPVISTAGAPVVSLQFVHHYRTGGSIRLDTGFVEVYNGTRWIVLQKYFTTQGTGTAPLAVNLNLTPHLNPNLQIRFRYRGNWAYYWAIDNLAILTPSPVDAGVIGVEMPANLTCGIPSPFPVKVRIKNFGSQTQTSIPVAYRANNLPPVTGMFTGTLNPGDSVWYTFSTPLSLPAGTYTLKSWTQLPSDGLAINDTLPPQILNRSPAGLQPLEFTGFSGANLATLYPGWQEQSGLNPSGTTSAWTSPSAGQVSSLGSTTAKINLFTTGKREWIMSPAFNPASGAVIRFKVAVTNYNATTPDSMDANDSLIVKVSTNCGQTWQRVQWFTKADRIPNQLVTKVVPLSGFEGQTIRFALFATEGTSSTGTDYDLHIDDLELLVPSPADARIKSLGLPAALCGVGSSQELTFRAQNNGTQPILVLPVSYSLNGQTPVSQTFSTSLQPGEEADFTFPNPLSFPSAGSYSITVWSQLPGDQNHLNDTAKANNIVRPPAGFPLVTFNGFTGSNLSTQFPGWTEASGTNPGTTTGSSWTNSSNAQASALGTAAAAKVNLYQNLKREWMISPPAVISAGLALRFKAAITDFSGTSPDSMGTDDSLVVKVTRDCGQTWRRISQITRADRLGNQFRNFLVPLAAFEGQSIRIGLFATEGTTDNANDYDLHLDDIELLVPSPVDVGLSAILAPTGECGSGSTLTVRVQVFNNGSLDLTSIPLSYRLDGGAPVSQTFPVSLGVGQSTVLSFSTPASIGAPGSSHTLSAWAHVPGDLNTINDTLKNVAFNRDLASFPKNTFTGFSGTNLAAAFPGWKEQRGLQPSGTASSWIQSNSTQTLGLGSLTARVNLFSNSANEWLVSPPFVPTAGLALRLKAAITNTGATSPDSMGSDDSVKIMVTTNCGVTWNFLKAFTRESGLTNTRTTHLFPLGAYAGESIRIGFLASEGTQSDPNDYDFHIDDVEVLIPSPVDAAVIDFPLPGGNCGAPSSFPVKIRIDNQGTVNLTSIPASYRVGSGVVVSETFSTNLNPGTSAEFTFSTPVNLPAPGTYTLTAWTSATGDQNNLNDTLPLTLVRPQPALDMMTFTGYTGGNLATSFPGWAEGAGIVPFGTFSAWTNSNATQTAALGSLTARLNLFGTAQREWIITPSISPEAGMVLSFKTAVTANGSAQTGVMGADDSVKVMVTTDCGQTWTRLAAFTAASNLTHNLQKQTLSLNAFAGQSIRIGFLGTDGPIDNSQNLDFHIDDIQVLLPLAKDLSVTSVQIPPTDCGGPTSAIPVKITISNLGTDAQSGFPVGYRVSNGTPVIETMAATLPPGQSMEHTFSTTLNPGSLTAGSTVRAWVSLPADGEPANDSLSSSPVVFPPSTLPVVTFTGFDGTNLSTQFPGWRERSGIPPVTDGSAWLNANGTQILVLQSQTARIRLFSNQTRAWILGPSFNAGLNSELRFRLAITEANQITADAMGSDDSLNVMISTDCGQTWSLLRSFTAGQNIPNLLTNYTADLSSFAGQVCQIGFLATDGTVDNSNDYDLHLDQVEVALVTGIAGSVNETLRVFPNPAGKEVFLEAPADARVQLISSDGRMLTVPSEWISERQIRLSLESIPAGLYHLRVQTGEKTTSRKLMVEK